MGNDAAPSALFGAVDAELGAFPPRYMLSMSAALVSVAPTVLFDNDDGAPIIDDVADDAALVDAVDDGNVGLMSTDLPRVASSICATFLCNDAPISAAVSCGFHAVVPYASSDGAVGGGGGGAIGAVEYLSANSCSSRAAS